MFCVLDKKSTSLKNVNRDSCVRVNLQLTNMDGSTTDTDENVEYCLRIDLNKV